VAESERRPRPKRTFAAPLSTPNRSKRRSDQVPHSLIGQKIDATDWSKTIWTYQPFRSATRWRQKSSPVRWCWAGAECPSTGPGAQRRRSRAEHASADENSVALSLVRSRNRVGISRVGEGERRERFDHPTENLKSSVGNHVRVQVPPSAPTKPT
jgi:hypothetical protein